MGNNIDYILDFDNAVRKFDQDIEPGDVLCAFRYSETHNFGIAAILGEYNKLTKSIAVSEQTGIIREFIIDAAIEISIVNEVHLNYLEEVLGTIKAAKKFIKTK